MDGLERDLHGTAIVVRVDILDEMGRAIAGHYGVRAVPTTLVIAGDGQIAYSQAGIPNRGALRDSVEALLHAEPSAQ